MSDVQEEGPIRIPPDAALFPELIEEPHRRLQVLKDNLEAFTIALILALVIKHFCVEAFNIPTGSMMPTLYGANNDANGVGDRILVDKWAFLGGNPDRWDVIVFRYPLNQSKHFIKRVGGVGGEWIKIVRGDIWVRPDADSPWRIATKRRRVRDELYLPVYPPGGDSPWKKEPGEFWEGNSAWTVGASYGELAFAGGDASTISFLKRIGDTTSDTATSLMADGDLVHDARFRMRLTADAPATVTLRWHTAKDREVALRLAPPDAASPSSLLVRGPRGEVVEELAAVLPPASPLDLEFECADGRVYVHVNGEQVAEMDEGILLEDIRRLDDYEQRFEIEAEGGPIAIEAIRVDRDVEYTAGGMSELAMNGPGLEIPEGHFFMLGDNTRQSSDSRKWRLEVVALEDGTEILYESSDSDNRPRYDDDGWLRVVDREGVERRWRDEDEAAGGRSEPDRKNPFVPRRLVVGRAFYVFWPFHVPDRAGFIH